MPVRRASAKTAWCFTAIIKVRLWQGRNVWLQSGKSEEQDYIFICVKNYSLEDVCESIRDMVTEDTVIIPVMNGVDPGENIRRLVGKGTVVDSLIYTVAFSNADFSVSQQDTFTWLCIGIKDADERQQEKVAEVAEILKGADIDYKDQGDIEVEIWRKYILNCAFNVMTAFYDNTIGELRSDPVKAQQYETLVWEAARDRKSVV